MKSLSGNWRFIAAGVITLFAVYCGFAGKPGKGFRQKWQAAGYPATLQEWDRSYPRVPRKENAAYVYRQAFRAFRYLPDEDMDNLPIAGNAELPPPTEPIPEEMQDAIARFVERNARAIALLHQASKMTHCRFPVNASNLEYESLHHFSSLRAGSRRLSLEALQHTLSHEPEKAAKAIMAQLGLMRSLDSEPVFISQLVRAALSGMAYGSAAECLNRTTFSGQDLARLQQAFATSFQPGLIIRAAMIEDLFDLEIIESKLLADVKHEDSAELAMVGAIWRLAHWTGLVDLDRVVTQYLLARARDTDHLELSVQKVVELKRLEELAEDLPSSPIAMISLSYYVFFYRAYGIEQRTLAHMRLAETALAIERYRAAKGHLPVKLEALVPEFIDHVPIDPYTDGPLSYRRTEQGYLVYSFYADLDDDGGERRKDGEDYFEGDIALKVERPAAPL